MTLLSEVLTIVLCDFSKIPLEGFHYHRQPASKSALKQAPEALRMGGRFAHHPDLRDMRFHFRSLLSESSRSQDPEVGMDNVGRKLCGISESMRRLHAMGAVVDGRSGGRMTGAT